MIIQKYICQGCGKEHERRVYADNSEGITTVFMEEWFPPFWEKMKHKASQVPQEDFCRNLSRWQYTITTRTKEASASGKTILSPMAKQKTSCRKHD